MTIHPVKLNMSRKATNNAIIFRNMMMPPFKMGRKSPLYPYRHFFSPNITRFLKKVKNYFATTFSFPKIPSNLVSTKGVAFMRRLVA